MSIQKLFKKRVHLTITLAFLVFLGAGSLAPHIVMAQGLVLNGDFETGDLSHWTVFQTIDGLTNEGVEMFDTTGTGDAYAAKFEVGRYTGATGFHGGGVYQTFNAPAGLWEVPPIAIAVWNQDTGPGSNSEGGFFELLIDGIVVDSHQFGQILTGQVLRATLSATGSFAVSGSHEVRIRITRPYSVPGDLNQYVDNINLQMQEDQGYPVGGTAQTVNRLLILLPWIGLAVTMAGTGVLVLRRRRAQS